MKDGKTVLITGTSSGIGRQCALHFAEKGWNVVATMRNPESRDTGLGDVKNIELLHLDVCDADCIAEAVSHTVKKYGKLDVVVNNAGYALRGPFEASTPEQMRRQFETNVFGLMEVCRRVLPVLREQGSGVIINLSSVGGRATFPLYQLYNSTKWAVEGFSEGLHWEVEPFGIRVKIIEPGMIETDFQGRSMDVTEGEGLDAYGDFLRRAEKMKDFESKGSHPRVVAETIYRAATDGSKRMRYPTGRLARVALGLRKLLPERAFFGIIRRFTIAK